MSQLVDDDELNGLVEHYEPEPNSAAADRWRRLFDDGLAGPILLINRFVFRDEADYKDGRECTGRQAFGAYAAVSMPALARIGGRFLASSPPVAGLFGNPGEGDLVVVGWYPNRGALLELLRDSNYQEAFAHRRAALAVDEVVVLDAQPL